MKLVPEYTQIDPHLELAWAAGFFDGEGTTMFVPQGKYCSLRLYIRQTNREPLDRFKKAVGGVGVISGPVDKGPKRKPMYFYKVQSYRQVKLILDLIMPYCCSEKREQARLAVERFDARPLRRQAPDEHGRNTQCPLGHVYAETGVYIDPRGRRQCLVCKRATARRYYERKKGETE